MSLFSETSRGAAARSSNDTIRRVRHMRHPLWRLTSWLSLSLAGCVQGWEGRKSVSKTDGERKVVSVRPLIVGPFAKKPAPFVSRPESLNVAVEAPVIERPQVEPRPKGTGQISKADAIGNTADETPGLFAASIAIRKEITPYLPSQATSPASVVPLPKPLSVLQRDSARPIESEVISNSQVNVVEYVPQPVPPSEEVAPVSNPSEVVSLPKPAAPLVRVTEATNSSGGFAEFERTVAAQSGVTAKPIEAPIERVTDSNSEDVEYFPLDATARVAEVQLPVIVPAMRAEKPASTSPPLTNSSPITNSSERAAVADPSTPPVAMSGSAPRASEVARLVDQVFDDLRKHRVQEARQRTEWLRKMVNKPISAPIDDDSFSENQEPSDE